MEDEPHSERDTELNLDKLIELVESDPRQTTRCLASALGCAHSTIELQLNQFGYCSKLGVWVPHDLS